MSPRSVTTHIINRLADQARAEGATHLLVAAIIEHHDRILLLTHGGDGFPETTWQPPTAPLFDGDTLTDVLRRSLAPTGLALGAATSYLGHHDHDLGIDLVRTLAFTVTVHNPDALRQTSTTGHLWTPANQLPANTNPPQARLAQLLGNRATATREEPPLAAPLRAHARGLHPTEAATELLINHAVWLHRADFTTRFVHHAEQHAGRPDMAAIDWPAAITALNSGQLPCSDGERRILHMAASLAEGILADLRDAATGLDHNNIALLCQAVLHASGKRPAN